MIMPDAVGPILFARECDRSLYHLSALLVALPDTRPALKPMGARAVEPVELASMCGRVVLRYDFTVPASDRAFYRLGDTRYPVRADVVDDTRIAYVSCNGQEQAGDGRNLDERNVMWRRLRDEHERDAFGLMLHGGDQLYADEVLNAHPVFRAWMDSDDDEKGRHELTDEALEAAEVFLFQRYVNLYAQPDTAHLLARVPSIMMWDDHDIIDGWGSHALAMTDSAVGQGLFRAARRMFMLFQMAVTDDHPLDPASHGSRTLGFATSFPGFDVIAPDLRSERRPDRVMGQDGWLMVTKALAHRRSEAERLFLMSSVPLLGPRLSWIESLIGFIPKLRRYEDDLRDQWQSHAHRREWKRFLELLEETMSAKGGALTVLSGEIHLATRAEMRFANGAGTLGQLVASGIAHRAPPKLYGRALGWLATFGEHPLPGRPIRMRKLPGQPRIYAAERNYLVLERQQGQWHASWELEESGRTPSLPI